MPAKGRELHFPPYAVTESGPQGAKPEVLAIESNNPLGRIARPEEIAAAAVFLAGPGATFMTGQCVSPNGGAVMF